MANLPCASRAFCIFGWLLVAREEAQESTCSFADLECQSGAAKGDFWPFKNRDLNHSGLSPYTLANFSNVAWEFEEAPDGYFSTVVGYGMFHASPLIDKDLNVYIISTNGKLYSLNKHGTVRWVTHVEGEFPGNPALIDGVLYTCAYRGIAYAIAADSGRVIWQVQVGLCCPSDTYSIVGADGTVLLSVSPHDYNPSFHMMGFPQYGGEEIVAVSTKTGEVKWRYNLARRSGAAAMNLFPIIVDGSVVFDNMCGALFRLSFKNGAEEWYEPAPRPALGFGDWLPMSCGGAALGPNGIVYVSRNRRTGGLNSFDGYDGMLRAHHLSTGKVIWDRHFPMAMNVGLAVGPLGPGGPLAVIAVPGDNAKIFPEVPSWVPEDWKLVWYQHFTFLHYLWYMWYSKYVLSDHKGRSYVLALDATTGKQIWIHNMSFSRFYTHPAIPLKGTSFNCFPDIAGNPSIGADGTVYITWSGGRAFALRDANGDGEIDASDPREMASYEHRFGANGNIALAPGFMVVPHCNGLTAFHA